MTKYYRVIKDNFLWEEGAVLKHNGTDGYVPVEDVWNKTPVNGDEYISARIIEHPNNAAFFERVYKDTAKDNVFRTAEQIKETYKKSFKK